MITITSDNTKMKVSIEGGPLNYKYNLFFECNDNCHAYLLTKHFEKKLRDQIETIRKQEYDNGYKDGRAKRGKKTWFSSLLKLV
jgi:hypothetical protein